MYLDLPNNEAWEQDFSQPLILSVDDDEDNLILASCALELFGYRVISAADGETALALIDRYPPSLILLDIVMPVLDGEALLDILKKHPKTAKIPIIAVTALASPDDREKLIQLGCDDYLSKPYLLEDLDLTVRRHLRLHQVSNR